MHTSTMVTPANVISDVYKFITPVNKGGTCTAKKLIWVTATSQIKPYDEYEMFDYNEYKNIDYTTIVVNGDKLTRMTTNLEIMLNIIHERSLLAQIIVALACEKYTFNPHVSLNVTHEDMVNVWDAALHVIAYKREYDERSKHKYMINHNVNIKFIAFTFNCCLNIQNVRKVSSPILFNNYKTMMHFHLAHLENYCLAYKINANRASKMAFNDPDCEICTDIDDTWYNDD